MSARQREPPSRGGTQRPHLSPETLTRSEQEAILAITEPNRRDHLVYSMALGTGLRLRELVGLNVGDVYFATGTPRSRVCARAEITKGGRAADVWAFWGWKADRGESLEPSAPLICNQSRRRIYKRRVQFALSTWQQKADLDRLYPFHALRHTAVTAVYRSSRDLFLAQRLARDVSPLTTIIYTHPSDEDLLEGLRGLSC